MNFFQANQILDGLKDNLSYNAETINRALMLTGDLSESEFERCGGTYGSTPCEDGFAKGLDGLCKAESQRA